jgi:hypothetical protein
MASTGRKNNLRRLERYRANPALRLWSLCSHIDGNSESAHSTISSNSGELSPNRAGAVLKVRSNIGYWQGQERFSNGIEQA